MDYALYKYLILIFFSNILNRLVFILKTWTVFYGNGASESAGARVFYRLAYWGSSLLYVKPKWSKLLCGVEKEDYLGSETRGDL